MKLTCVFVGDRSGQAYCLSVGLCLWVIGLVRLLSVGRLVFVGDRSGQATVCR